MIRALKTCRFGGQDYRKGDVVPEAAVDKNFIGALVGMKIIEVTRNDVQPLNEKIKLKAKRQSHAAR